MNKKTRTRALKCANVKVQSVVIQLHDVESEMKEARREGRPNSSQKYDCCLSYDKGGRIVNPWVYLQISKYQLIISNQYYYHYSLKTSEANSLFGLLQNLNFYLNSYRMGILIDWLN